MGKSNRIRNDRASSVLASVKAPKKKKGMPSWALNLITILVTAAVLFSVVFMIMSANGVFGRISTAMKSENFRVTRNMMDYYFQTQYNSFVSENSSYLQYYGLDTGLSLKEQYVPGDTSEGAEQTSWFDYLMDSTKTQVEEILIYCEEAEARNITLEPEDIEAIEAELATYETYAEMYGYDTNSYVAQIYGNGMKIKDIRAAMELSTLASKCSEAVGTELEQSITDTNIEDKYNADPKSFNNVDYSYYTISVKYEDAIKAELGKDTYTDEEVTNAKDAILDEYKAMIEKARNDAKALSEITDASAFKDAVIEKLAQKAWDDTYDSALKSEALAEENKITDEQTDIIEEKVVKKLSELIKSEAEFKADDVTDSEGKKIFGEDIEGLDMSDKYVTFLKKTVETMYTTASGSVDSYFVEGATYSESDDVMVWAFESGRKAGDTKTVESGDGADNAEIPAEPQSFSISAYYMVKPEYKDETPTKNVGLMVFSSSEDAAAAIAKLSTGITVESFETVCNELGGKFTNYKNYTEGSMGVTAFDTWLYDDATVVGTYTAAAISLDESSYAVALYYADGEAEWKVAVKSAVFNELYEKFDADVTAKYAGSIIVKDRAIGKIDA